MHGCADVEGELVAAEDAKTSIFDRGFLHGEATDNVAPVRQRRFFRLDDPLARFQSSLADLRLDTRA